MTDRELFIKALDALEWNLPVIQDYGDKEQLNIQHNAINALRDRLAQPEQEPVAWRYRAPVEDEHWMWNYATYMDDPQNRRWCEALYTTPPQRPWVGLTNQQIMDCTHHMANQNGVWIVTDNGLLEFAHILEEWLKGKNT